MSIHSYPHEDDVRENEEVGVHAVLDLVLPDQLVDAAEPALAGVVRHLDGWFDYLSVVSLCIYTYMCVCT